jgi:hypothetical protein
MHYVISAVPFFFRDLIDHHIYSPPERERERERERDRETEREREREREREGERERVQRFEITK